MTHEPAPKLSHNSLLVQHGALEEFTQVFKEQWHRGFEKYGGNLHTFNGRDAGNDAFQELADAVAYVMQLRMENQWLKSELQEKYFIMEGLVQQNEYLEAASRWTETGRLMQEILGTLPVSKGSITIIPTGEAGILIRTVVWGTIGTSLFCPSLNGGLKGALDTIHKETQQE
jgi:hypothetical protein